MADNRALVMNMINELMNSVAASSARFSERLAVTMS
jgi:hypothetical protein